jgi:hypothetical protein
MVHSNYCPCKAKEQQINLTQVHNQGAYLLQNPVCNWLCLPSTLIVNRSLFAWDESFDSREALDSILRPKGFVSVGVNCSHNCDPLEGSGSFVIVRLQ